MPTQFNETWLIAAGFELLHDRKNLTRYVLHLGDVNRVHWYIEVNVPSMKMWLDGAPLRHMTSATQLIQLITLLDPSKAPKHS